MMESAFPILEVSDMEVALAFYHDALGGSVRYRFPPEGEGAGCTSSLTTGSTSLGIGLAE